MPQNVRHDALAPCPRETADTPAKARAANANALDVRDLCLSFGGVHALSRVSIGVGHGEFLSIIGPNGAGKTSLLNCIAGRSTPNSGRVRLDGVDVTRLPATRRASLGLSRTFQNLALFDGMSVLDNVLVGRHGLYKRGIVRRAFGALGGFRREEEAHRRRALELVDHLGLASLRDREVGSLPYGIRKRVELARALAPEPRVLLLDEPMAGMNAQEKRELAGLVLALHGERDLTIVMIEHDIGIVSDVSDRVVALNLGRLIADGSPGHVLSHALVRESYLGDAGDVDAAAPPHASPWPSVHDEAIAA